MLLPLAGLLQKAGRAVGQTMEVGGQQSAYLHWLWPRCSSFHLHPSVVFTLTSLLNLCTNQLGMPLKQNSQAHKGSQFHLLINLLRLSVHYCLELLACPCTLVTMNPHPSQTITSHNVWPFPVPIPTVDLSSQQ